MYFNNPHLGLLNVPGRAHLLIRAWGVGPFFVILVQNHSFSYSFILLLSLTSLLFRLSNLYPGTTTRWTTFSNPSWGLLLSLGWVGDEEGDGWVVGGG